MDDDERTPALQRPRDATRQLVNDDNTMDNTIDNDSDDNDERTPIVYMPTVIHPANDRYRQSSTVHNDSQTIIQWKLKCIPVEVSVKPILKVRFRLKQYLALKCLPITVASSRHTGVLLGQCMELLGSYTDCISGSLYQTYLQSQKPASNRHPSSQQPLQTVIDSTQ